jgi:hypothetical protein
MSIEDQPKVLPLYWRVCRVEEGQDFDGTALKPGWWAFGFPDEPPNSSTRGFANRVDSSDGAIVAIEVLTSSRVAENPKAPLDLVLASEITRALTDWSLRALELNPEYRL